MRNIASIICLLFIIVNCNAQHKEFKHDFAPAENFTKPVERPYRDDTCLNGYWQFAPVHDKGLLTRENILHPVIPQSFEWEQTAVKIPSPWNINSFADEKGGGDFVTYPSYPKTWDTTQAGWLMRKFTIKQTWRYKRLILHFDAVAGYTQVFINGQKVAGNYDVFLPFDVDITDKVNKTGDNELLLWVADADLLNQPGKYGRRLYVGGSFWGQHINGIWQDVTLIAKPATYVKSSFIQTLVDSNELRIETVVTNTTGEKQEVDIAGTIYPWINKAGKTIIEAPGIKWVLGKQVLAIPAKKITLQPGEERTVLLSVKVNGKLALWNTATPNLYGLVISLNNKEQVVDKQYNRFGWRQCKVVGNKLLLNGGRVVLKGDSWHFMGIPQMTRRYAWAWYTMLKDAHANAVRLHAQPYPQLYLDMADEMGIFVLDETGLWASDGGPKEDAEEHWDNAAAHVKRFILRDRNHPSVFGWSVCNENIPVAVFVHHSPDSLVQKQLNEINHWVAIARETDPTRNWISGDGETGRPTGLPVTIGHYGDENAYKDWSSNPNKLWGIGEGGMAYYGTPRQTAAYNGSRSYVSQQGRMEGVADEAIHLFNLQKKYDASYRSVFNIVWYGLKPLELGLKDTTIAPTLNDGIFFDNYKEGQPGIQPERLGPYTSTLNPGYDASLPLYRTWPLFDAIKLSNETNDSVAEVNKPATVITNQPVTAASPVKLLSADTSKKLYTLLHDMGVNLSDSIEAAGKAIVIVDGEYPPSNNEAIISAQSALDNGGIILVLGAYKTAAQTINRYLPAPVTITERRATSFITVNNDTVLNGLQNADFYFSELSNQPIAAYGLSGDFVNKGKVLLAASNTDWRAWNNRPEYAKTISVLRSEREAKPAGNVLVSFSQQKGIVYCTTLNPFTLDKTAGKVLRSLFLNIGIGFTANAGKNLPALDTEGTLQHVLVVDSVGNSIGSNVHQSVGQILYASNDFFSINEVNNTHQNDTYLSFWVYSPRSLVNLLAEPDMPVLNISLRSRQIAQVYLGKTLLEQTGRNQVKAVPLEKGWNRFVIKIKNGDEGRFSVKFDCTDNDFMHALKSSLYH